MESELRFNAVVWFDCVLFCIVLGGCACCKNTDEPKAEIVSEKKAEKILRKKFNGL